MMKKILLTIALLLSFASPVYAEEGPFYFDWENFGQVTSYPYDAEYSENVAFNDTYITVKHQYTEVMNEDEYISYTPTMLVERYNKDGEVIASKTVEDCEMYSVITNGDYIYMVVIEIEDGGYVQKLIKLNANLEREAELTFKEEYTPGVDGMVNARRYGHDILAVHDDYLYIFCGEDYMLRTKLDLGSWDVMQYTKTNFTRYFPDLSLEYDIMAEWEEDLYNGDYPVDMMVTTHVYEDKIITSGMRWYSDKSPAGVIQIHDKRGNLIFEVVNPEVTKYYQARIIKGYVVAIGLEHFYMPEYTEIHVYNMNEDLEQVIAEEDTHYMLLQETKWGFMVTHVDDRCSSLDNAENCARYNNEVWYMPLNITTKVISGEGTIDTVATSRFDEEITFKVTPGKGYELAGLRVYDANGNEVTYSTDYKFIMPNADVTIEAVFVPENPKTGAKIGAITFGALLLTIPIAIKFKKKDKLFNV